MSAISTPCQIGESRGKRHDVCGGRGKQIPEFGGGFRRHDGPIMAENHRGGIAHLRGGQVFVAMHGVVVRTESMTQDIHRKLDPSIRGCLRKQEMPVSTDERSHPPGSLSIGLQPCLEIFGNRDNASLPSFGIPAFHDDLRFRHLRPIERKKFACPKAAKNFYRCSRQDVFRTMLKKLRNLRRNQCSHVGINPP